MLDISARLEALAGSPLYWWIKVPHDTLLVENAREAGGNPEVTLYGPKGPEGVTLDRSMCYVCPYVFGAGHASALPATPSLGNESLLLEQFSGAERIIYACSREFLIDHGVSPTDADVYVRRTANADTLSRIQRSDDVLNGIELKEEGLDVTHVGFMSISITHSFAPDGSFLQADGLEGVFRDLLDDSALLTVLQRADGTQGVRVSVAGIRGKRITAAEVDVFTSRMLAASTSELFVVVDTDECTVKMRIMPDLTAEISASMQGDFMEAVQQALQRSGLIGVLSRVFGIESVLVPGEDALQTALGRHASRHMITLPHSFPGIAACLEAMEPVVSYARTESNTYEVSLCRVPDFERPSPLQSMIMREQYLLNQGRSDEVSDRIARELAIPSQDVHMEIGNYLALIKERAAKGRFSSSQTDAVANIRRQASGVVVTLSGMRSIVYAQRLLHALARMGTVTVHAAPAADSGHALENGPAPQGEQALQSGMDSTDDVQAVLARVQAMSQTDVMPESAPEHGAKYVLNRLYAFDRELFNSSKPGFSVYAKICGAVDKRQPIALTQQQLADIHAEDAAAGREPMEAVTSLKGHAYICPDVWCPVSQKAMSMDEYNARGCLAGEKGIIQNDSSYWKGVDARHPGYLRDDKHPTGLCMPCCFKRRQDTLQSGRARMAKCGVPISVSDTIGTESPSYVMGATQVPLPPGRRGEIGGASQLAQHSLLRIGVEQTAGCGFLASVAFLHSVTVEEVRERLADVLTVPVMLELGKEGVLERFIDVAAAPSRGVSQFTKYLKSAAGKDHLRVTGVTLKSEGTQTQNATFLHEMVLWDAVQRMREYVLTGMSMGHTLLLPFITRAFPGVLISVVESLDKEDIVHTPLGGAVVAESMVGIVLKNGEVYEPLITRGKRHNDALLSKVHPVASRIASAYAQANKVYKNTKRGLRVLLAKLAEMRDVKIYAHVLSTRIECVGVLLDGGLFVPLPVPDLSSERAPKYMYESELAQAPIDGQRWNAESASKLFTALGMTFEVVKDALKIGDRFVALKRNAVTEFLQADTDVMQFVKIPPDTSDFSLMHGDLLSRAYDIMRLHMKANHLEELYVLTHPMCPYPRSVRVNRLLELTSPVASSFGEDIAREAANMVASKQPKSHTETKADSRFIIGNEDDVIDGTLLSAVMSASSSIDFFRALRTGLIEESPVFDAEFADAQVPAANKQLAGKLAFKASLQKDMNAVYTIGLILQAAGQREKVTIAGYIARVVSDAVNAAELRGEAGIAALRLSSTVTSTVLDEFSRKRGAMIKRLKAKFLDPRAFAVGPGDVSRALSGAAVVAIVLNDDAPVITGSGDRYIVAALDDTRVLVAVHPKGGVLFGLSELPKPLQRLVKA